jgi:sugar phosphate isomerase/epimerase
MWNASVQEIFSMANFYKVGGIELWAEQAEAFHYNTCAIRRLAQKYDIKVVVHSKSWDLNFASLNKSVQRASLRSIKKSIDFAKVLGASEVTIHPPRQTLLIEDSFYIKKTQTGLEKLLEYSEKQGVSLSLEIMEKLPKEIITTPETLKTILGSLYESFIYTVDIAHCNDKKEIFSILASIDSVSKIHISNKRGKLFHTPLYDGDFDFQQILPRLKEYNVPLVIEGLEAGSSYQVLKNNMDFVQNVLKEVVA